MKFFQTYLFVGNSEHTIKQTITLAKKLGISMDLSSPDITIVAPTKSTITIDQIRWMKKYIFEKPFSISHKLVIIEEAQALTTAAQGALLKILEEPPAHA